MGTYLCCSLLLQTDELLNLHGNKDDTHGILMPYVLNASLDSRG